MRTFLLVLLMCWAIPAWAVLDRILVSVPLEYARNIRVKTTFTRGNVTNIMTVVVDEQEHIYYMRISHSVAAAYAAHEAAEEWTFRTFPRLPEPPELERSYRYTPTE